jgi:uncharacterized protein (TIGR02145 family)
MEYKNILLIASTLFCIGLSGLKAQTMKDTDGNVYKTVTIGKQVWMAENLKTTKFSDGTAIPFVIDSLEWKKLTTPAYSWYNNDTTHKNIYGALYNWYTVNTNKLCPDGWHVPSNKEWKILTTYLGGESVAGGKLKEAGTTHWKDPNNGATNQSGYNGLPGGFRHANFGKFYYAGIFGYLWTSSPFNDKNARHRHFGYEYHSIFRYHFDKRSGFSVRCLQDQE